MPLAALRNRIIEIGFSGLYLGHPNVLRNVQK